MDKVDEVTKTDDMYESAKEMVNDLVFAFNLIYDDVKDLFKKAQEENWSIDELIMKVEDLM